MSLSHKMLCQIHIFLAFFAGADHGVERDKGRQHEGRCYEEDCDQEYRHKEEYAHRSAKHKHAAEHDKSNSYEQHKANHDEHQPEMLAKCPHDQLAAAFHGLPKPHTVEEDEIGRPPIQDTDNYGKEERKQI